MNYYITDSEFNQVLEDFQRKHPTAKGSLGGLRNKLTLYRKSLDILDINLIRALYWHRCFTFTQIETYFYSKDEAGQRVYDLLELEVIEQVETYKEEEVYRLLAPRGYNFLKFSYKIFEYQSFAEANIMIPPQINLESKNAIKKQIQANEVALSVEKALGLKDCAEGYGYKLMHNTHSANWYLDVFHYKRGMTTAGVEGVFKVNGHMYYTYRVPFKKSEEEQLKKLEQLSKGISRLHRKLDCTICFLCEEAPTPEERQFLAKAMDKFNIPTNRCKIMTPSTIATFFLREAKKE